MQRLIKNNTKVADEDGLSAIERRHYVIRVLNERGFDCYCEPSEPDNNHSLLTIITYNQRKWSVLFSPNAMTFGVIESMFCYDSENDFKLLNESEIHYLPYDLDSGIVRWKTADDFLNFIFYILDSEENSYVLK
jgi:hypothetical protein